MISFTFGTDEHLDAICEQMKSEESHFSINLNMTDFRVLTTILRDLALYGEATRGTRVAVSDILGTGTDEIEPIEDWSAGWLSAIGESLGVEGI